MEPEELQEITPIEPKKRRRRAPTIKQIKAVQFMNQGMTPTEAQRKAGYSPGMVNSHGKAKFFKQQGVQTLLGGMKEVLISADLTQQFMATKMREWMDATKVDHSHTEPDREVPDYKVQMDAYDRWLGIMSEGQVDPKKRPSRKVTFEEWVGNEGEK